MTRMAGSLHGSFFVGDLAARLSSASELATTLDVVVGLLLTVGLDVSTLFDDAHSRKMGGVCSHHRLSRGEGREERALSFLLRFV